MLPFAYEMKDVHSDIKVNAPSFSFGKECRKFRTEILNQHKENKYTYSLSDWFDFSQKLWVKIDKFKNLINYISIDELNQDKQLAKLIESLVKEFKEIMDVSVNEKKSDNLKIDQIVDECCKGFDLSQFYKIEDETMKKIENECFNIKENFFQKFEQECSDRNISPELTKKRKNLLDKNMNKVIEDWKHHASRLLNETKIKFSKAGGDSKIKRELDRLQNENEHKPYSKEIALKNFKEFWQNNINFIKEKSIPHLNDLKEKCFKLLKKNYESCTTNLINDYEIEQELKKFFESKNSEILKKVLNNKEMFFFKKETMPEIEELHKIKNNKCNYFSFNEQLFEKKEIYHVIKINLDDGFNRKYLENGINLIIKDTKTKFNWKNWTENGQKDNFNQKLGEFLKKIKNESSKLGLILDIKNDFSKIKAKEIMDIIHNRNRDDNSKQNKNKSNIDTKNYNNNNYPLEKKFVESIIIKIIFKLKNDNNTYFQNNSSYLENQNINYSKNQNNKANLDTRNNNNNDLKQQKIKSEKETINNNNNHHLKKKFVENIILEIIYNIKFDNISHFKKV